MGTGFPLPPGGARGEEGQGRRGGDRGAQRCREPRRARVKFIEAGGAAPTREPNVIVQLGCWWPAPLVGSPPPPHLSRNNAYGYGG
jgi:hypothetical protein